MTVRSGKMGCGGTRGELANHKEYFAAVAPLVVDSSDPSAETEHNMLQQSPQICYS
jgi:hypothetical protein